MRMRAKRTRDNSRSTEMTVRENTARSSDRNVPDPPDPEYDTVRESEDDMNSPDYENLHNVVPGPCKLHVVTNPGYGMASKHTTPAEIISSPKNPKSSRNTVIPERPKELRADKLLESTSVRSSSQVSSGSSSKMFPLTRYKGKDALDHESVTYENFGDVAVDLHDMVCSGGHHSVNYLPESTLRKRNETPAMSLPSLCDTDDEGIRDWKAAGFQSDDEYRKGIIKIHKEEEYEVPKRPRKVERFICPKSTRSNAIRQSSAKPKTIQPFDVCPDLPQPFDVRPKVPKAFDVRPKVPRPFDVRPKEFPLQRRENRGRKYRRNRGEERTNLEYRRNRGEESTNLDIVSRTSPLMSYNRKKFSDSRSSDNSKGMNHVVRETKRSQCQWIDATEHAKLQNRDYRRSEMPRITEPPDEETDIFTNTNLKQKNENNSSTEDLELEPNYLGLRTANISELSPICRSRTNLMSSPGRKLNKPKMELPVDSAYGKTWESELPGEGQGHFVRIWNGPNTRSFHK